MVTYALLKAYADKKVKLTPEIKAFLLAAEVALEFEAASGTPTVSPFAAIDYNIDDAEFGLDNGAINILIKDVAAA